MNSPLALIVEDDYDLSQIFAKALQAVDFETHIVRSGDAALQWLDSTAPDVVILDLHLPKVSGPEILQQIRSRPQLRNTRVIVTTADPRTAESVQSQADLTLIKPISFTQLRDLASRLR